jgi:rare lipoprotein A
MADLPRSTGRSLVALAATTLLAAGPTSALASNGGTSAPGGDLLTAPTAGGLMPSGGALAAMPLTPDTLQAPATAAIVGQATTIRGELTLRDANRPVLIEIFDPVHGWQVAATGKSNTVGAFAVSLTPKHIGRFMFRATTTQAATAALSTDTPSVAFEVYRPVTATIFGQGSYGTKTACGEVLTPQLLGVAHLSLPCGTLVAIAYGNQTITVPVVDRGPYVTGVSYDLTTATAAALGIDGTAHIGALAIRGPLTAPAPPAS